MCWPREEDEMECISTAEKNAWTGPGTDISEVKFEE